MKNVNKFVWLKAACIRAAKTFGQTVLGTIGAGAVTVMQVDWQFVLGAAALASVISLCTSLAGLPEVTNGGEN